MSITSQSFRMKTIRAIGVVAAVLTAAACSERRSTGPGEPPVISVATTKLPALSVHDDPIIALSDTIWGGREPNELFEIGYGITLHRPDDLAFDRVSDIVLSYRSGFLSADVHVYHPRDSVWMQIDAPWEQPPRGLSLEPNWTSGWLLSEANIDFDDIMTYGKGRLHLGGSGFMQVSAQLVRHHDDYRGIRLGRTDPGNVPWIEVTALACGGGRVWVAVGFVSYQWGMQREAVDSIWAYDSTGTRVAAYGHELEKVWGMEYYEDGLLALADRNRTLVKLDESGNVTRSAHWDHDMTDITIAMGRLWLPEPIEASLRGFVLDSAFWQGNTRIDWNFHLPGLPYCYCTYPPRDCNCVGVTWDGSYFYIQAINSMAKINLSNELVERYTLPVTEPRRLAWDGEAFWVVHRGPAETKSTTWWLSRFSLP